MQCGGFRISYRGDERIFDTAVPIVGILLLTGVLVLVPWYATTYWLDVINRIGIAIIGALGLNILVGYTGQISIGHAAFLAVGAYATAILEIQLGLPFYLAIPLAGLITAGFGLIFGFFAAFAVVAVFGYLLVSRRRFYWLAAAGVTGFFFGLLLLLFNARPWEPWNIEH